MKQREFRRILRQAVYVPILLLLLLAVFFIAQLRRFSNAVSDLHRADLITNSIIDLQKLILDQETGLRGFELTGDPTMLAPYTAGTQPIQQNFADLRRLLAGDSAQEQRLATLSKRYELWLGRARRIVANDKTLVNKPKADEENKILMDDVRSVVHEMLITQEKQREERFLRETPYVTKADLLTTLLAAFIIGLIVAVFT